MQICEQGAKRLACAVLELAAQDYQEMYKLALRSTGRQRQRLLEELRKEESFFLSEHFDLYGALTGEELSGSAMIVRMRQKVEECVFKRRKK